MLQKHRKNYENERFQFILTDANGSILESDQTLFTIEKGGQIGDFHPFFLSIPDSVSPTGKRTVFQCVHLSSGKLNFTTDIEVFKKNEGLLIVIHDLTEHYLSYQAIAQARNESIIDSELVLIKNRELEERERFKNEFIQNFSHEIRNPLTNIMALTNILGRTKLDSEQKRTLAVLKESSSNLKLMLEDILSISMISKGKLALNPGVFHFAKLIDFLRTTYNARAKEKGLVFTLLVDEKIPEYLEGDRLRLLQVLTNLCDNAIKYTQEGSVALQVTLNQKRANIVNLRFGVRDTGKGIDPENSERIFESFEQLGPIKGAGLGLSIVKGFLGLMGSEIRLDSNVAGGSYFYFDINLTFPLHPVQSVTESKGRSRKSSVKTKNNPKRKVLLVEDDEQVQMTLFKMLVDAGDFYVDLVSDGALVIEEVMNGSYDIILLDVNLPNISGDQLASLVRDFPFNNIKRIPIIGVTANSYEADIKKYLKAGMNAVLTKPFEESELLKTMYRLLK